MKLYTHEEMLDENFGVKGTPRRDKFEKDIQDWLIAETIKRRQGSHRQSIKPKS